MKIVLVACASSKALVPKPARELYESALFRKSRAWAERVGDRWFILSALQGLVDPDEVIEPYDVTLSHASREERRKWAARVFTALQERIPAGSTVYLLAGRLYRDDLVPLLEGAGFKAVAPMQGLGIGQQLAWLS